MIRRVLILVPIFGVGTGLALQASSTDGEEECGKADGQWFGEVGCEMGSPQISRIVVDKSERSLIAFEGEREVRRFNIALGRAPVGDKQRQGDGRTPEGSYPIVAHNPRSQYHLSLRLGYPTPAQIVAAREAGIDPGGDIMIHGLPNATPWLGAAHRAKDWTLGCIALTNDEINWLYRFTPDGTMVEIEA